MAKWKNLATLVAALTADVGSSRHRTARMLRFVFRHPRAHAGVKQKLLKRQRQHLATVQRRRRRLALE